MTDRCRRVTERYRRVTDRCRRMIDRYNLWMGTQSMSFEPRTPAAEVC